jgi:hypothetical protein
MLTLVSGAASNAAPGAARFLVVMIPAMFSRIWRFWEQKLMLHIVPLGEKGVRDVSVRCECSIGARKVDGELESKEGAQEKRS